MPLTLRDADAAIVSMARSSWMIVTDAELRILRASGGGLEAGDPTTGDYIGRTLQELLPPETWAQLEGRYRAGLAGQDQSFEHWTRDGQRAWWIQIARVGNGTPGAPAIVTVAFNLTEQLRAAAALHRSDARLRESEQMIGIGSFELTLGDERISYSPGFARVLGLAPDGTLALEDYRAMVCPEDREKVGGCLDRCVREGASTSEYRIVGPQGKIKSLLVRAQLVSGPDDSPGYVRGALLDVTEQRETERERVSALALFAQGFEAAPIGMALTDISGRYLRVNDALCSLLGRAREELLELCTRDVSFAEDRDRDEHIRQAMLDGAMDEFHTEKRYLRGDGSTVWAALHVAPVRASDGSIEAFIAQKVDISERKEREARLYEYVRDASWLAQIRDALDNDRFRLYWQPIVDVQTGRTVQRELLIRMCDDNGNVIAPAQFLPVAERYGLVCEIDRWVIRQAIALAADGMPTEFNLSALSIADPHVTRELADALAGSGVDPALLIVEVTETAMMDQPDAGRRFAAQVRALGCGLAIDDFGTGFASLTYLKHLEAGYLKIDMEFVRDLARDETNARLVRGIVGLAREFDQVTVAEGVEDEETMLKLRELGVARAQGYYLARPMPTDPARPSMPAPQPASSPGPDPIPLVKSAFEVFSRRDLAAAKRLCHPELALRTFATASRAGRDGAYRGHDGLRRYFDDVAAVWDDLRIIPSNWWETEHGVVVAGRAIASAENVSHSNEALWIFRFRDGLISGIDVFPQPR